MKTLKHKTIIFIGFTLIIIFFILLLKLLFVPNSLQKIEIKTDLIQKTENSKNFDSIIIGKDTFENVVSKIGKPDLVSKNNDLTYLFYKTSLPDDMHKVVVKNNVVLYVLFVTGDNKNYISDLDKYYGAPSIVMYDKNSNDFEWYIYLDKGLALKTVMGGYGVMEVARFVPQNKNTFDSFYINELGLKENEESEHDVIWEN